jgi:hypothetical protein
LFKGNKVQQAEDKAILCRFAVSDVKTCTDLGKSMKNEKTEALHLSAILHQLMQSEKNDPFIGCR